MTRGILRTARKHRKGDATRRVAQCGDCARPMVSRRRHDQLGRPESHVRHAARGLCTGCYDRNTLEARDRAYLERTADALRVPISTLT